MLLPLTLSNIVCYCIRCCTLHPTLLAGYPLATEPCIRALVSQLARTLRSLSLPWSPIGTATQPGALTEATIAWLAAAAPRLEHLDVVGCKGATANGIRALLDGRAAAVAMQARPDGTSHYAVLRSVAVKHTAAAAVAEGLAAAHPYVTILT
jgi:hypothetical protein